MASFWGSRVVALLAYPFLGLGAFYLILALAEDRKVLLLVSILLLGVGLAVLGWAWFKAGEP